MKKYWLYISLVILLVAYAVFAYAKSRQEIYVDTNGNVRVKDSWNGIVYAEYQDWCPAPPGLGWTKGNKFTLDFEDDKDITITLQADNRAAVNPNPKIYIILGEEQFGEGVYYLQEGWMTSIYSVDSRLVFDILNCGNNLYLSWGKG